MSITIEWLALFFGVPEVPDSNLGPEVCSYQTRGLCFLQSLQTIAA